MTFSENQTEGQPMSIGTIDVVSGLNAFWDRICSENGIDSKNDLWSDIGYYLIELGKNAIEHGREGCNVKVTIDTDAVTVSVTDLGLGFDDPDIDIDCNPGHGLSQIRRWADEFVIESNGKKFTGVGDGARLIKSNQTDIQIGTRITFVKNTNANPSSQPRESRDR